VIFEGNLRDVFLQGKLLENLVGFRALQYVTFTASLRLVTDKNASNQANRLSISHIERTSRIAVIQKS